MSLLQLNNVPFSSVSTIFDGKPTDKKLLWCQKIISTYQSGRRKANSIAVFETAAVFH